MNSSAKAVSLRISAIVHATEDPRRVSQAMRNVCPFTGSAELDASRAKGHHGNEITTFALVVKNPGIAEKSLRQIWNRLGALDKETILSSLAARVDKSGALFLRVDKQEGFKGKIRLNESDPVKVSVSFPSAQLKQDEVVTDIRNFLTENSSEVAVSD